MVYIEYQNSSPREHQGLEKSFHTPITKQDRNEDKVNMLITSYNRRQGGTAQYTLCHYAMPLGNGLCELGREKEKKRKSKEKGPPRAPSL